MTTLLFNSGALNWTVVLDNRATPAADLHQALVAGRALDEADARPVDGLMQLSIDRPTLATSVDGDGMFGWSGVPRAVWGGNAAVALACRGSVEAPGFLPRRLDLALPAQPGYPDVIQALNLGGVELHRVPVGLRGRAVAANGAPRPFAQIDVSGLWHRSFDYIDETSPSTIGTIAAVAPGLARFRDGAGLQARVWQLQLQPQRSALLDDALPGARRIRVSAGVPFAPGSATDVIAIAGLGDSTEILHVDAVASPVTPDEVLVDLRHPLAEAHVRGGEVRNAQLAGASAWSPIQHGVHAGDRSVCLANGGVLATAGDLIEIDGGGVPSEIATLARVTATADAGGFYSLPPLHRASLIRLRAQHAAELQPAEATFVLEPSLAAMRGDIVFPI
jgi:hypothetical protein